MSNNDHLTATSILLIFISVLLWGWAFPLIKITLDFVPPLVIGYFRYFFASLPFLFYIFYKFGIKDTLIKLKLVWPTILALGTTMVTIPNITQNIGLLYTTSSIAALITTVAPVFTVIIAIIILHESKTWQKFVGLLVALTASVLIVVYTGLEISDATLFGNTLIFITSVSYGISGIFSKTALKVLSPIYVTGFGMFFGSIILIPLSILFNEPLDWPLYLPLDSWIYLVALTIFPCLIATFFWYVVLETHEVSKQVLFTYLIPVFAATFAFFMLGEVLKPITILLGGLIILGISLAEIDFGNKNSIKKKEKQR